MNNSELNRVHDHVIDLLEKEMTLIEFNNLMTNYGFHDESDNYYDQINEAKGFYVFEEKEELYYMFVKFKINIRNEPAEASYIEPVYCAWI